MDIITNRNDRMPSPKAAGGVIDLRGFSAPKTPAAPAARPSARSVRTVSDIRPTTRAPKPKEEARRQVPTQTAAALPLAKKASPDAIHIAQRRIARNFAKQQRLPEYRFELEKEEEEIAPRTEDEIPIPVAASRRFHLPALSFPRMTPANAPFGPRRELLRFALATVLIPVVLFSFSFMQTQFDQKGKVLGMSTAALDDLKSAASSAAAYDFRQTNQDFEDASLNFAKARETVDNLGLGIGEIIGKLPVGTPVSTAQGLTGAGQDISLAGKEINAILAEASLQMVESGDGSVSLEALSGLVANLERAAMYLSQADDAMGKVDVAYVPVEMQGKITLAKTALPALARNFTRLKDDCPLLLRMLGSQREEKYLLLFENSSEMRATGGFIGSYGILDIKNGKLGGLAIDGIFNPDGQFKADIVPPTPIQKISANWSMHDSNWFADYPTSAQKTALFYEKTGGPTVDGVIAITPAVIQRFLAITGPIELPEYGVIVTADNFVTTIQNQVEELYDKEENRPKKILSDLEPVLFDKLLHDPSLDSAGRVARLLDVIRAVETSLNAKDILIYHRDPSIENMLIKRGWGGEIIQNQTGDYLDVIDSNINGFKTDAVITESIDHQADIQADGTIIDTVTVTRKHNGGSEQCDWYNRVNADYLRVYVPKGSVLLSASGHTPEEIQAPIDYSNFATDPDVAAIESTLRLDPDSKTQVFEESGKTVFGNWVYVSPQESVTVTYRYRLPFKMDFGDGARSADAYSLLVQKQAGALGSSLTTRITAPSSWETVWQTSNLNPQASYSGRLDRDLILARIFTRR